MALATSCRGAVFFSENWDRRPVGFSDEQFQLAVSASKNTFMVLRVSREKNQKPGLYLELNCSCSNDGRCALTPV